MRRVACNGAEIPAIGLGTWELRGEQCAEIVGAALALGYRHVDTAQMYENEGEVGAAIRASGVPRDEIFLTTKVWRDRLGAGELERSVEESLERLDTGYADLVLIHWPNAAVPLQETLEALARVRRDGRARHIGISNFPSAMIDDAVAVSPEPIVTNQIEYHPYLDQSKVVETCRKHGISVTAYCPIARARVVGEPVIEEIAAKYGRTPAQVTLHWLIQQPGGIAVPRTQSKSRLAENLDVEGFTLTDEEMAAIAALAEPGGRIVNAAWAPDWD